MLDTTWKGWGSRIPGRKDHIKKKAVCKKKNSGGRLNIRKPERNQEKKKYKGGQQTKKAYYKNAHSLFVDIYTFTVYVERIQLQNVKQLNVERQNIEMLKFERLNVERLKAKKPIVEKYPMSKD
jgi:hypothetical protein